jgi:hypothetical protein
MFSVIGQEFLPQSISHLDRLSGVGREEEEEENELIIVITSPLQSWVEGGPQVSRPRLTTG